MRPFAYERPHDLDAVVARLAELGPDGRLLAGGTDLLIRLRDGTFRPRVVVDLKGADGLDRAIRVTDDGISIGAGATMTDVMADESLRRDHRALVEAAAVVGSVQIRNRATLAGNQVNASPAADTAPALLAFGARVVARGPAGERRFPLDALFVRSGVTTLGPGEIVAAIVLPRVAGPVGSVHLRRTRRRGHDLASVTMACVMTPDGVTRLAYGSVGPRPVVMVDREGILADASGLTEVREAVLDRMLEAASPSPTSLRAGPDYRLAMLRLLAQRAIAIARTRLDAAGAAA